MWSVFINNNVQGLGFPLYEPTSLSYHHAQPQLVWFSSLLRNCIDYASSFNHILFFRSSKTLKYHRCTGDHYGEIKPEFCTTKWQRTVWILQCWNENRIADKWIEILVTLSRSDPFQYCVLKEDWDDVKDHVTRGGINERKVELQAVLSTSGRPDERSVNLTRQRLKDTMNSKKNNNNIYNIL